jgi:hypothetical protein
MKEMGSPEMIAKYNEGPVGVLTVMENGPMNMGRALTQWFLYSVLIGLFVAYVASLGLAAGAGGMAVFRLTSAVAVLAYGVAQLDEPIWRGVPWATSCKYLIDGLLYGCATGAAFAWLWPGPA